jgi:uncharacterized protein (TIGR00106 family)
MEAGDQIIDAEISIIPFGTGSGTSMSKEIAAAFDAIRKIEGIKNINLTPMGTQIEANSMTNILKAIEIGHQVVKSVGAMRIISTIHIDERLDKPNTFEGKVESVKEKLSKE